MRAIANPTTRQTYTFTYNTDAIPHLTQINNVLGNGSENYTLGYLENQTLASPFSSPVSFGTTTLLQSLAVTNLGYSTSFAYNTTANSGELTSTTTPLGGTITWAYDSFTYNGTRTYREVENRFLTTTSGGTQSGAYVFTRPGGDSSLSLHSGLTIADPSGIGARSWTFATSGTAALLGTVTQYQELASASSTVMKTQAFTWVQDSLGNPYVGTSLTTLDPTGANVQSKVTQTLDTYGNVTQKNIFNYGNLTTAARTYNYTYLTGTNYSSQYIFNRLLSASVTDGTHNVTLVTNTYDNQTLTNITGSLNEHDSNYSTSLTSRGNVTVAAPVGGPSVTTTYDITGTALSATDNLGHTVSVTTGSTTNYTAPTAITPNSNTSLQTTAAYTQWLSPSSVMQPNNAQSSTTYDTFGRPLQSTSVYGAQTNYTYSQSGTLPMIVTATTNSHWTKTTLDGFGRTIEFDRGYNSSGSPTTVSTVKTGYAPVACSPLENVIQVSRPFAPGGTVYLTTYSYDGRGRTLNTVLPDGASTTKYTYAGNVSTVTDPAGNWKQDTYDVFGHLTVVTEPNPAGGNFATNYSYDVMDHLTGVSMLRSGTTQTRTFTYDPTTQRLTSQQHPESGTTSYTYNADGTVATRTDNGGRMTQWNYDTYKRVTSVQRFPTAGNEDTCQGWNFTYDGNYPSPNLIPPGTVTNALGRLSSFYWRGSCTEGAIIDYAYTPAGLTALKVGVTLPQLTYNYDTEGKVTSFSPPSYYNWDPARTYTYSVDLMDRPTGMTDSTPTTWVQNVQYGPSDEILQRTRLWFNGSSNSTPTETRQYNALGQLTRVTIPGFLDQEYDYSATANNGRITQAIDHIKGETIGYTYDSLNRLATATSSLGWGLSFTYDGFGNLTDKTITAGSAPPLHVIVSAATNQLSGSAYTYDANGNLTTVSGQFSATYNLDNQVYTLTGQGSYSPITYYYDHEAHRQFISAANGDYIYWEGYGAYGEHFQTADNEGGTDNRSIYFGTEPIYHQQVNSNGYSSEYSIGRDRLGTLRSDGTEFLNYYPYGEEYATTTQDREKFATYIRDSVSVLDFAQHRYYSNILGRFTSADPSMNNVNLGNPLSWNRYAYANNDPINMTDPSGLCNGGEDFNDTSCMVSAGDEGSNGSTIAPDPNGTATDSNGNTVGVQVEGTSITVSDTADPVNPYDASIPSTLQNASYGGPSGPGTTGIAATTNNSKPPACQGVTPGQFDYTIRQPYLGENGRTVFQSAQQHITEGHIFPGEAESTMYIIAPFPGINGAFQQVVAYNAATFTFGQAQQQGSNGNISFTFDFPVVINPFNRLPAVIGADFYSDPFGVIPLSTNKLVLAGNCTTVRTSFPTSPISGHP